MLVRRLSLTVFCGLRKVRFQCYCTQFKFNRIFLVLKVLSTTFYIIGETLALMPFVEASLSRFKKLFRRPFLTVFCAIRKVRFHCYCAQFNFNRIVLVLKLLSMTFYIIVKTLAQIPFVEASICRFKKLVRRPFFTVFCALRKVRFQCYCAQFNFNRIFPVLKLISTTFYIIVKTFVQIPFVESSLWRIQMLVRRLFLTVFCGLRKVRFQCYCAQFKFNRIILVHKLLSMIFYIIVKSLVQISFVESSLWRIQMLVRRRSLTVFCGLRKVRFQCYCVQFKFNRIFLVLELLSTTFYIIVKTLAQIHFVESSLWRFKKLVRRPFLTFFCGLRQLRFQCYCAQFKSNRIVLVLKLLSMTFCIIVKSLVKYFLQNPRYGGFKCWFEGLLSQFFADYAKYVSNATVLSSSSIEFFLCSNYFQQPFISSLKLWLRYHSQKPRYRGLKNCFEDLFSQFFSQYGKYVSIATVLSSTSIGLFLCSNYFQ